MEDHVSTFINTTLIITCLCMAVVFLTLPLPTNRNLKKYRISLRFLAGAYITLAVLKSIIMYFDMAEVNIISMERLTISSLQATLFAISMITLINPKFVTRSYLIFQLCPIITINLLYLMIAGKWCYPEIRNFNELIRNSFQPAIIIREFLLGYYIFQLIYLTRLLFKQVSNYKEEINNYFSEGYQLYLPWVKYSIYVVVLIGIGALLSCFLLSESWMLLFTVFYGTFYFIFGIYYIQYPNTFIFIEPAIYPSKSPTEETLRSKKRLDWDELKKLIIAEKYYLNAGITIEDMAHYLKIGRTSLSNFINNEEGMNFNMWINFLRIEEAKVLLTKNPTYNLTQIAEMIGYSEPSNFSRQFKIITNESPSVWRQNSRS